jgi:hypothetical protein
MGGRGTWLAISERQSDPQNAPGELNVVPAVFFGVSYSQEEGVAWPKMKCLSKGANREITR